MRVTNDRRRTTDDVELTIPHHVSRTTHHVSTLVLLLHLALVIAQVGAFGVPVGEGRSIDVAMLPEPLYKVDGLGLALGVAWCLGMALVAIGGRSTFRGKDWAGICLLTIGMLNAFYARLPLVLYAGWEVAGLGLWLGARPAQASNPIRQAVDHRYGGRLRGLPASPGMGLLLHAAGWPLLLVILLGLAAPFAPPAGGVTQAWPLPVILGLAVVVLIRSGCPPFSAWTRSVERKYASLLGLYMVAAPMLLAKMLVAAPWDAVGGWALALVGTAALLVSVTLYALRGETSDIATTTIIMSTALAASATAGFGLATSAPVAAAGAIALLLVGMIAVTLGTVGGLRSSWPGGAMLLGTVPGVWILSQGALGLGYGVVAALALPAIAAVSTGIWRSYFSEAIAIEGEAQENDSQTSPTDTILPPSVKYSFAVKGAAILALVIAVYPQALVEIGLRPAVGAMAGGVGTIALLKSDWGVGLSVAAASGSAQALLPATGIGVAAFLAWVTLYWLRGLVSRFVREQVHGAETE